MRLFVTGGSGFIGSAVVPELLGAGHQVLGLARSDASAAVLSDAGAEVLRGDLEDLDSLRRGAAETDGVVHLGYVHDFSDMAIGAAVDLQAIRWSGRRSPAPTSRSWSRPGPCCWPSATSVRAGRLRDGGRLRPLRHGPDRLRERRSRPGRRGVRSAAVRLAPTVHGVGDHGFVPILIGMARRGACRRSWGRAPTGAGRAPLDAARLFRLAAEGSPAGRRLARGR